MIVVGKLLEGNEGKVSTPLTVETLSLRDQLVNVMTDDGRLLSQERMEGEFHFR